MKSVLPILSLLLLTTFAGEAPAQEPPGENWVKSDLQVEGIFPHLTVYAHGAGSTSETGIGALIPWADRLWAIGYVAHIRGAGIGLYEIRGDLAMRRHPPPR